MESIVSLIPILVILDIISFHIPEKLFGVFVLFMGDQILNLRSIFVVSAYIVEGFIAGICFAYIIDKIW
jgi:hypothetical protein